MKKTLFFEARTDEEQKEYDRKWLQKSLDYAMRVGWERETIKKDLLAIADNGEYEDLRREVVEYFKN